MGLLAMTFRPGASKAISFQAQTRAKTSKNETNVSPNETFRSAGRKPLKSLWALNQSFRGIVCAQ
jgi:hypothetical protein